MGGRWRGNAEEKDKDIDMVVDTKKNEDREDRLVDQGKGISTDMVMGWAREIQMARQRIRETE